MYIACTFCIAFESKFSFLWAVALKIRRFAFGIFFIEMQSMSAGKEILLIFFSRIKCFLSYNCFVSWTVKIFTWMRMDQKILFMLNYYILKFMANLWLRSVTLFFVFFLIQEIVELEYGSWNKWISICGKALLNGEYV